MAGAGPVKRERSGLEITHAKAGRRAKPRTRIRPSPARAGAAREVFRYGAWAEYPEKRMITLAGILPLGLTLAVPAAGPVVTEPRTGVAFETKLGDMSLLGVGLRTKTFLKFKVYALGLYVADSALKGRLASHKGRFDTSAFYRELVVGDFEKEFVLKLVRDLSADQIQGTFRSHMPAADPELLDRFVSYFAATKAGQECVLHWIPGGRLEATVAGVVKPPIVDKPFADAVFAIWLRDRPEVDPIRRQLVSRAGELIH
jgi:Chalcone isomerase-like